MCCDFFDLYLVDCCVVKDFLHLMVDERDEMLCGAPGWDVFLGD